ncbi:MAG: fumarate/nitrate reduction transcriptional regulator Fnr [Gammaproteobacteria bacterium]|nr:fumarate/nitrate reduction transcriptional regulator Fnr [Gammaproteobacteria bacterium]MBU1624748.1 fumarate/nitrate reduction transcriptional regulator Fnr [Gammaproteobacteria bacterium]MBU1982592.1 fumarate/nitrate reduction transcriptional regulator Fnr [Gammaproteobacteria bacterium]
MNVALNDINQTEITRLRVACSNCNLRELCLPVDLTPDEMTRLEELSNQKRSYATGDYLYRSGDRFKSLHAIRSGSFKTRVLHEDGREQVTGFLMAGEIIGLDAISTDIHTCEALAMEDSEVCELPYSKLAELSREIPSLQRHVHKIMSREIVRDQGIMLLLGSMRAEERLAAFLLNMSQRNAIHGMSATQLRLRMSRLEIGSYLGLKLETVSRAFSHFQDEGLIQVKARAIEILALSKLREMVGK